MPLMTTSSRLSRLEKTAGQTGAGSYTYGKLIAILRQEIAAGLVVARHPTFSAGHVTHVADYTVLSYAPGYVPDIDARGLVLSAIDGVIRRIKQDNQWQWPADLAHLVDSQPSTVPELVAWLDEWQTLRDG